MKKVTSIALAIVLSGLTVFASVDGKSASDTTKTAKTKKMKMAVQYTCPMHPDYITDKPGKCPRPGCGMTLVKKEPAKKKMAKMKM
jgi:hypothetical protein